MFASVHTATLLGMTAHPVRVEVDIGKGLPATTVAGLGDTAVLQARDRIRAAFGNAGFDWPDRRITIALAPTDLPKHGPGFDVPIAIGLLAAAGKAAPALLDGLWALGELSLDGTLRPVRGVLPAALAARAAGARLLVVPTANLREAATAGDLPVLGARSLAQVGAWLRGQTTLDLPEPSRPAPWVPLADDFADIGGQAAARRALEIAAAGGHHVLLVGPPGTGKTMLARRLPGILPVLDQTEALEVAQVRSVAGLLSADTPLTWQRPFRAPHHALPLEGLIGGGGAIPRPGEVSLAHHGVLLLDDLAAFSRLALDALRQPLEDGVVTVARATLTVRFPARFILVATAAQCPCGHTGDPVQTCRCSIEARRRYQRKVFGPLTDRIDLITAVERVDPAAVAARRRGESSARIRSRVVNARARQAARGQLNARLVAVGLEDRCHADPSARQALTTATERLGLTSTAYQRTLRLARTLADLADVDEVTAEHITQAIDLGQAPPAAGCDRS